MKLRQTIIVMSFGLAPAVSIALVNSSDLPVSEDSAADNALVFGISKSIAIGE